MQAQVPVFQTLGMLKMLLGQGALNNSPSNQKYILVLEFASINIQQYKSLDLQASDILLNIAGKDNYIVIMCGYSIS
jgi:hypothetical protein